MLNPKKKLSQTDALSTVPTGTRLVVLQPAAAQPDAARRVATATPQAVADYLGQYAAAWNAQKNPLKVVSTVAEMRQLNPLACCQGTEGIVLAPGPGESPRYVLRYTNHALAWHYVCVDGTFNQTSLTDAEWYPVDSPRAGLQDYSEYPGGFAFPAGTFVAAYVSGQTTEQIFKRRSPGGTAPAPVDGGDTTYWEPASLTDVPAPGVFLSPDVVDALETAANPSSANPFATAAIIQNSLTPASTTKGLSVDAAVTAFALKASRFNVPDYAAEIVPAAGDTLNGSGKNFLLGGGLFYLNDPVVNPVPGAYGRIYGLLATAASQVVFPTASGATIDGAPTLSLNAGEYVWLRYQADGYSVRNRGSVRGPIDPYDVSPAIRSAVTGGTFSLGELTGTQPTGSLAGMEFTTTTYGYKFQRGAAGTLVWNRYAKS